MKGLLYAGGGVIAGLAVGYYSLSRENVRRWLAERGLVVMTRADAERLLEAAEIGTARTAQEQEALRERRRRRRAARRQARRAAAAAAEAPPKTATNAPPMVATTTTAAKVFAPPTGPTSTVGAWPGPHNRIPGRTPPLRLMQQTGRMYRH